MKKRKEDQSIHRSILQRSWCLPGLLLVTLWPCMVHLDRVRTWMEEENWYPDIQYIDDYFMHIKSCTFLFLAGVTEPVRSSILTPLLPSKALRD